MLQQIVKTRELVCLQRFSSCRASCAVDQQQLLWRACIEEFQALSVCFSMVCSLKRKFYPFPSSRHDANAAVHLQIRGSMKDCSMMKPSQGFISQSKCRRMCFVGSSQTHSSVQQDFTYWLLSQQVVFHDAPNQVQKSVFGASVIMRVLPWELG